MKLISAVELIKQHKKDAAKRQQVSKAGLPQLGRDNSDFVMFDENPPRQRQQPKSSSSTGKMKKGLMNPEVAKQKALAMMKRSGNPLSKQDPNCVGREKRKVMTEKKKELVRKRAETDWSSTQSESNGE